MRLELRLILRQKFISSCSSVPSLYFGSTELCDKLCASKIKGLQRVVETFSFWKERKNERWVSTKYKTSQYKLHEIQDLENNLHWLNALLSMHTGVAMSPPWLCSGCTHAVAAGRIFPYGSGQTHPLDLCWMQFSECSSLNHLWGHYFPVS